MPLRERKKTATRMALHEAALRLAVEHGLERITVEAIADAASVSRRTFSNYFAGKEEALLYGDHARMRTFLAHVRDRPAGEPPWEALTRAAERLYLDLGERDPRWVAQSRLLRGHPSLLERQAATYAALERDLATAVAARLPAGGSPLRARVTAAAFLSAWRAAVQVWLDQPPGTSLAELARDALGIAADRFE
ncbi:TetR family transcriptional regulator [Virgisporangium aliadipatigenens]|uniref:TetR family transcriptional regulator n=2 Tax=Virgisporangium aliadipatigenens TaxID=741659 RepID=A0A8J4DR55_9ACTN|nr:TetR family transcriptional regulator [Virgisporangium aliadipatigenens]